MSKLKNVALLTAIMSLSPAILANYNSSITGIDLSATYNPPDDVAPIICRTHERDDQGKDDVQSYKACQMGVAAAKFMAEKYAQGEGRFLGCVDGLQQGVFNGFVSNKNPSAEMINQARAQYSNTTMNSAVSRATDKADSQGESVAAGEIISRFREVVNTDSKPNSTYSYPDHDFSGFENGYEFDKRGGDFGTVTRLGWVNSNSALGDKIAARAVYNISQTSNYGRDRLCQSRDVLFDNLGEISLWDYFSARGRYNFTKYGWREVNRSWDFFVNREAGHVTKLYYQNEITDKTESYVETYTVQVPVKKLEPVLGPDGKPTGEYKEVTVMVDEQRTRVATRVIHPKSYYQGIYGQSFREAYDQYYLIQYFGRGFVDAHRTSRTIGELAGAAIGQGVAKDTADELAYNAKYKLDSLNAFATRWRTNFDREWARIWNLFENNAMVELNELSLVGADSDDIFMANERLSARVAVTNLGRKADSVSLSLFGDINGKSESFSMFAPVSSSVSFATPVLASISNGVAARQNARVGARVTGAVDFSAYLDTDKGLSLLVNEVAEINKVTGSLEGTKGKGSLQVEIVNPSNRETTALVTVRVDLGKFGTFQTESLKLAGKESRIVNLPLSGFDPLELILEGGLSGSVETMMNGRVLHESSVTMSLNQNEALVDYFNALVTGQSTATGSDTVDGRIQELMNRIQDETAGIAKNTDWGNDSAVSRTLVGMLGRSYLSAQAAGVLNATAKAKYNQLGAALDSIDPGVFKRKAYRAALNRFAPDVKVKKKNK